MTTVPLRPAPVGREELLARLERVLHTRGRALLTGPAGVGKTEVALAAAARAEARGETVLWLATLPADRDIPGAAAAAFVASVAATVSWPGPSGAAPAGEAGHADRRASDGVSAPAGPEADPSPRTTARRSRPSARDSCRSAGPSSPARQP
ncbi:AAA family ATPase, partial [Streptomyces sp. NPDC006339]|uniref:AAA family ATPase n=1 Tax=Streptomyces sp. NPDC006339 TaxID=3156755 RepID=UPI0033B8EE93